MLPKTKLERTSDFDACKREKKGKIWFEYTPNPFVNKSLQHIKPILSPLKLFLDDDEDNFIYTKHKILLSLNYVLIKWCPLAIFQEEEDKVITKYYQIECSYIVD